MQRSQAEMRLEVLVLVRYREQMENTMTSAISLQMKLPLLKNGRSSLEVPKCFFYLTLQLFKTVHDDVVLKRAMFSSKVLFPPYI